MDSSKEVVDIGSRLMLLRQRAQNLRFSTADPELRWELVQAESVADVMLGEGMRFDLSILLANAAFLSNLLYAIEERIGTAGCA
ncbi:MAG: hypothetical protein SGI92_03640 [Bryobacteraceae bacterium]|nr:hypothetical protein [Bryobacteraceae bacterium]